MKRLKAHISNDAVTYVPVYVKQMLELKMIAKVINQCRLWIARAISKYRQSENRKTRWSQPLASGRRVWGCSAQLVEFKAIDRFCRIMCTTIRHTSPAIRLPLLSCGLSHAFIAPNWVFLNQATFTFPRTSTDTHRQCVARAMHRWHWRSFSYGLLMPENSREAESKTLPRRPP